MSMQSFTIGGIDQRLSEQVDAPFGLKNLLINGDFRINQRAFAGGELSSGTYGYDRWKADTANTSLSAANGVATISKTTPEGAAATITQVIEGSSVDSGVYVVSWEGTATCTIDGVAKTKGATVRLKRGTDCTVKFSTGSLQRPQLERGRTPTRFDMRPIGLELFLCQRYFERIGGYNYEPLGIAQMAGTTAAKVHLSYKVPKRTTPTVSTGSQTAWSVDRVGAAETSITVSFNLISARGCQMQFTVAANMTNLGAAYVYGNNSALAYVDVSAEL